LNLKQKAISGVKWTTVSSVIIAITQLVQLSVLARFLSANEFGLIAILMVIINFSLLFIDFGISKAIIYKRKVSQKQLDTLYWLNILLSIFIFIIIIIMSPYIANFYNENSLEKLINLIGVSFIVQAFGQQYRTLFQKELNFKILAKIDSIAAIFSFMIVIFLITHDYKIYAFVYSIIIIALIRSILLVYYGISIHKIKMQFDFMSIKDFLAFGFYSVGNSLVSTIATQIDVILIGKLLGTESLGLYSIMKELVLRPAQLINPIVTKVAFPVLSKFNDDISKIRVVYLKLINYISSLNFPVYIASFILAPEIITIFLGDRWLNGVEIFQILSVWALVRSRGNPIGSLVMAMGKPEYEMYWNIGMMFTAPIVVYISSSYGIIGIAWGNLISIIILFIPGWYFLTYRLCKASLNEYFMSSFYPLVISIFTGLIINGILFLHSGNIFYKFFITSTIGLPIIYFLYKKLNSDFYNLIIEFVKRKK